MMLKATAFERRGDRASCYLSKTGGVTRQKVMDETMAVIDGVNGTAAAYLYEGQSFEELKQLLACVSMELRSQRDTTKVQEQLHEARVRHLEELLKTARRERDEFKEQFILLKGRLQSSSRSMLSGLTQEPQLRTRSGLQPLESVASMTEPSRKSPLEYVSSMSEPTRDTLTEVHRKMQEQQKQQHQLELQQLDMQQLQHHHMDLQNQHNSHGQLDLRPFQSKQQQLDELCQHFEIQQKDPLPAQSIHMDMAVSERHSDVSHSGDMDNGSDAKSTTWNEFPSSVLDIHSSNQPCLILDSPEHMHIKLTQGLPAAPVDQRSSPSSHLDDFQQQLQHQQHQHHQDDNMQMHLHHQQQESEEILSRMQQGQTPDAHSLHLQDEQKLRRQISKRKLQDTLAPISVSLQGTNDVVMSIGVMPQAVIPQHSSGGLQGTNDVVMNMAVNVLPQHASPWPVGMLDLSPPQLPNGTNGISEQLLQGSCLQGGSVVASILSPLERFGDSSSTPMRLARPLHLPEPPEADPQVMLSSLPEKGKLLDAVMNAGPLLQTLMLAGPLPQWRHPPPPLDAEEIPKVSIRAAVGIMAPGAEQGIGLLPSHGRSLEQVMRLSATVHTSPTRNGFCH